MIVLYCTKCREETDHELITIQTVEGGARQSVCTECDSRALYDYAADLEKQEEK